MVTALFCCSAPCQSPAIPPLSTPSTSHKVVNPVASGLVEVVHDLDTIAALDTAARRATIAAISNRIQAELRQQEDREKVLSLIGGLPEHTPLHAQSSGVTQLTGFRMEKVLFNSQPGFHVTALLYLPDNISADHASPAILMTRGHYPSGKAADHSMAAAFARNGFVVLSYDPIGEGERLQYPDPARPGTSLATRPTGEHGEASLQPMLIGDAIVRYFVWDAMRGIDYLTTRPEVDPKRIGALGCSGGGAITVVARALDPRIAAIGVACYITSFDELLPALGPQDGEQSIPHFIASGLDFPDWIEAAAPRPYAVIATYSDMFPFTGARSAVIEARRFYSLFDPAAAGTPSSSAVFSVPPIPTGPALNVDTMNMVAPSAPLQFITGPGGHAALTPILGNILSFFMRNLEPGVDPTHPILAAPRVNGSRDPMELFASLPKDALQVTPTGQVATSYPGAETVFSLNLKRAAKVIPHDRPRLAGKPLAEAIRVTTGLSTDADGCHAEVGPLDQHVAHVVFHCADGVDLQGVIALPSSAGRHSAVILLVPDSIDGASMMARANRARFDHLAADGNLVLAIAPRPSPPGTDDMKSPLLGPYYLLSLRADLVSKTPIGMRVEDVLHIVRYLAQRHDVDPVRITAMGCGHMGLVLLYAATLDPSLKQITIDHVLSSYKSLIEAPIPIGASEDVVPGVLLQFDIPDTKMSLGSRLTETNPLQGTAALRQSQLDREYP